MTTCIHHEKCLSTNVRLSQIRQKAVHGALELLWNVTPTLTKLLVKKMFFTPSAYKTTPVEKQYLEKGESFQLSVHDKTVQCWKWGAGPSILLAHGWNGRGIQLHHFIEPLVQRGYSVIGYDAPGHGVSQGKTSSYFEFTDTIRTLLTSSNGHKIQGVIAHSLGASATVNSIAKENQPLEAVLIAPALRFAEVLTCFFDHVGVPTHLYNRLIQEYENQFGYDMRRDNPANLFKEINSEILLVHDIHDPTIPYSDSKELSNEFQNISLHTTEGLGHKRILTDESVVDSIVNHFRKNGAEK
jgi:pimeloyl-ACP methyl ester carboxylesterase